MPRPVLTAAYAALGLRLQESVDTLSAGDIRTRLSDAVREMFRNTGKWGYYIDHFGDSESGDVIYCCDDCTKRAPYEISGGLSGETSKCIINTDDAEDVVPRTVYEVEQDEADHIASMESLKTEKLYGEIPVYERFIPKASRDKASASDFAGKGKSFPILKGGRRGSRSKQFRLRAGASDNLDAATIKANIIRIAKRKGLRASKSVAEIRQGQRECSYRRRGRGRHGKLSRVAERGWCAPFRRGPEGHSGHSRRDELTRRKLP